MNTRAISQATAVALLAISAVHAATPEPGWFGVTYVIYADGFLDPTIRSVTVASVRPDSPAAQGRIGIGDEVLTVDDRAISGVSAIPRRCFGDCSQLAI